MPNRYASITVMDDTRCTIGPRISRKQAMAELVIELANIRVQHLGGRHGPGKRLRQGGAASQARPARRSLRLRSDPSTKALFLAVSQFEIGTCGLRCGAGLPSVCPTSSTRTAESAGAAARQRSATLVLPVLCFISPNAHGPSQAPSCPTDWIMAIPPAAAVPVRMELGIAQNVSAIDC